MNKISIGSKFGKLKVVSRLPNNKHRKTMWCCVCDCGGNKAVAGYNLTSGKTKSCGCIPTGVSRDDGVIGQKFNLIIITKFLHADKYRKQIYQYVCECGNVGQVSKDQIVEKKSICKVCPLDGCTEISGTYWTQVKTNAKKREIDFDIGKKEAYELFVSQQGKCALSGIPICFAKRRSNEEQTASLDRIDNSKGYIPGNIQWVHKTINRIKLDLSEEEFIDWCCLISEHRSVKSNSSSS